jgi:hypothetical protein
MNLPEGEVLPKDMEAWVSYKQAGQVLTQRLNSLCST